MVYSGLLSLFTPDNSGLLSPCLIIDAFLMHLDLDDELYNTLQGRMLALMKDNEWSVYNIFLSWLVLIVSPASHYPHVTRGEVVKVEP